MRYEHVQEHIYTECMIHNINIKSCVNICTMQKINI